MKQHNNYRACGTCISARALQNENRVLCTRYRVTMSRCGYSCNRYRSIDDKTPYFGLWDEINKEKFLQWHNEFYKDLKHAF